MMKKTKFLLKLLWVKNISERVELLYTTYFFERIIDDIGEGLDFERSTKLIELLISKAEKNPNMQLLMSTNDSFVMNSVDLKYWQIIDRVGCQVNYYNYSNSPKTFEDYKLTGLNHFDFFASGFFKDGFSDEELN